MLLASFVAFVSTDRAQQGSAILNRVTIYVVFQDSYEALEAAIQLAEAKGLIGSKCAASPTQQVCEKAMGPSPRVNALNLHSIALLRVCVVLGRILCAWTGPSCLG